MRRLATGDQLNFRFSYFCFLELLAFLYALGGLFFAPSAFKSF
jgi:hypothetical protein